MSSRNDTQAKNGFAQFLGSTAGQILTMVVLYLVTLGMIVPLLRLQLYLRSHQQPHLI